MTVYFHSIPASLPPQERIVLLRECVIRSALHRAIFMKKFLLVQMAVLMIQSLLMFGTLLLMEGESLAATVLGFAVWVTLVLELCFSPTRTALRHAVRVGKLTELANCMNDVCIPVSGDDFHLWQSRASLAGASDSEFSLFDRATWKKGDTT